MSVKIFSFLEMRNGVAFPVYECKSGRDLAEQNILPDAKE
jgi:hypothetical protein